MAAVSAATPSPVVTVGDGSAADQGKCPTGDCATIVGGTLPAVVTAAMSVPGGGGGGSAGGGGGVATAGGAAETVSPGPLAAGLPPPVSTVAAMGAGEEEEEEEEQAALVAARPKPPDTEQPASDPPSTDVGATAASSPMAVTEGVDAPFASSRRRFFHAGSMRSLPLPAWGGGAPSSSPMAGPGLPSSARKEPCPPPRLRLRCGGVLPSRSPSPPPGRPCQAEPPCQAFSSVPVAPARRSEGARSDGACVVEADAGAAGVPKRAARRRLRSSSASSTELVTWGAGAATVAAPPRRLERLRLLAA